jgi:protoporphyrinogen oxidase
VLIKFEKTIKIKFLGKYFDFPLSIPDILTKLPPLTVLHALLSFAWHFTLGFIKGNGDLTNSEKVLKRYYGDVLYRLFFEDYIYKVWGIPPSGIAASFAKERIPRLDILDVVDKLKRKIFGAPVESVTTDGYVEKVAGDNYTTKKGFSLIADCYAEELTRLGGTLLFNAPADKLLAQDGRIHAIVTSDGKSFSCDEVVSTVPISLLPGLISPPPSTELLNSAAKLRYRGITFVGLLINRRKVLPASFMYFRDKCFNRITDLGQFEVEVSPAGATILIAEITCQPGEPLWNDHDLAKNQVIDELIAEGLLGASDILEAHVFQTHYGYPIYEVGYEKALKSVLSGISSKYTNLQTIGRQGKFAYINTHIAMKMGYEAARTIEARGPSTKTSGVAATKRSADFLS